jgi:hypothetical protein
MHSTTLCVLISWLFGVCTVALDLVHDPHPSMPPCLYLEFPRTPSQLVERPSTVIEALTPEGGSDEVRQADLNP